MEIRMATLIDLWYGCHRPVEFIWIVHKFAISATDQMTSNRAPRYARLMSGGCLSERDLWERIVVRILVFRFSSLAAARAVDGRKLEDISVEG